MAACEGCTCGRANGVHYDGPAPSVNGHGPGPRREVKSFTAPAGWVDETEGIEPAVPLRSKLWFNNPKDGKPKPDPVEIQAMQSSRADMVGNYTERYMNTGLTRQSLLASYSDMNYTADSQSPRSSPATSPSSVSRRPGLILPLVISTTRSS